MARAADPLVVATRAGQRRRCIVLYATWWRCCTSSYGNRRQWQQGGGGPRDVRSFTKTEPTSSGDAAGSRSGAATTGGDPAAHGGRLRAGSRPRRAADGGTVGGSRGTRAFSVPSFLASGGVCCIRAISDPSLASDGVYCIRSSSDPSLASDGVYCILASTDPSLACGGVRCIRASSVPSLAPQCPNHRGGRREWRSRRPRLPHPPKTARRPAAGCPLRSAAGCRRSAAARAPPRCSVTPRVRCVLSPWSVVLLGHLTLPGPGVCLRSPYHERILRSRRRRATPPAVGRLLDSSMLRNYASQKKRVTNLSEPCGGGGCCGCGHVTSAMQ